MKDPDEAGYFLHVRPDASEVHLAAEPPHLRWKTHYVRIVEEGDNYVVEQTTLVGKWIYDSPPHGAGWRRIGHDTLRRTRLTAETNSHVSADASGSCPVGASNEQQKVKAHE